jgi:hypothetical protein
MNLSLKRAHLFAMGMLGSAVALLAISSPRLNGQELAHLNPMSTPAKSVVRAVIQSHPQTPAVYTDWLPARIVWSNNLLRDVAKECSSFVGKYDARFNVSKEDPRDYGSCVVQLYDAVGSLRTIENWNPALHPKSKRGRDLKVYMAHEYGTRRFGVYELSELTHGVTVVK